MLAESFESLGELTSAPVTPPFETQDNPPKFSLVWWVATTLLLSMAGLFSLCSVFIDLYSWVGAVRSFSEAALVGALADWFAVTALFRHPLGLPIPHTAIIPRNKIRIGKSLGVFVQRNFLSKEALDGESLNITGAIARWLELPANRKNSQRTSTDHLKS